MNGRDIRIGGRTLDVLITLVDRVGQVVSREELGKLVWPHMHVVDSALRFQINSLRTILAQGGGKNYVSSVAGRGYCFTADVRMIADSYEESTDTAPIGFAMLAAQKLVGRATDGDRIAQAVRESRLVTIVGPGGMGKTSIAIAVGKRLKDGGSVGNVDFIDFALVTDPLLAVSALASGLGLGVFGGDPIPGIAAHLDGPFRLLVWDNCEHVIDAVATMADRLLSSVPNITILATSREPLRVAGEHVYRLQALSVPPEGTPAERYREFDAVSLFLARTEHDDVDWDKTENQLAVSEICRSLEGIPLAIEMAARRVSDLGLGTVHQLLGHSLSILTKNSRGAPERHQTMRAALDWSYEALSKPESEALRRLSAFRGPFTRDDAFTVAGGQRVGTAFCANLSDLIYKSLVTVDVTRKPEVYRLPQITREYSNEKLIASGDQADVEFRHQRYVLERLKKAALDLETLEASEWRANYSSFVSDVRAALQRAFSDAGSLKDALRLTAESSALWMELGLLAEYRGYLAASVSALEGQTFSPEIEMKIVATFGMVSHHTEGATERTRAAMRRALELADQLGDVSFQQKALTGIASERLTGGHYSEGLEWAREFERRFDHSNPGLCSRVLGHCLQHNGLFAQSTARIADAYRRTKPAVITIHNSGVQYDERMVFATQLSRNLWIQGYSDQSLQIVRECIDHAVTIDHSITIGMAFSTACVPLALIYGDYELAAYANSILQDHVTRNSLDLWKPAAAFYDLTINARNGQRSNTYGADVDGLTAYLGGPLLEMCAMAGDELVTEGMLAKAELGTSEWCKPDLMRSRAERLRIAGHNEEAETMLERAAALAVELDAPTYELRIRTSLAKIWKGTARQREGVNALEKTYGSFREGFGSRDFGLAAATLRDLGSVAVQRRQVA